MGRIKTLRNRKAALVAEQKALFDGLDEGADLNEEQAKRDDAINAELETLNAQIAREERRLDNEREMAGQGGVNPNDDGAVEGERIAVGTDRKALKPFKTFGEQLQAIHRAHTGGQIDPRLYQAAATGAGEAVDSEGGFLVQMDFSSEIIRRMYQMGQVLSRVRKVTVSSGFNGLTINAVKETSRATGSRWGGVQGYWVDEGTAATATTPKWRRIELKLRKLAALGYATDELMADAAAISQIFTEAFAEELMFLAEDAIMNGTGAGQPMGVLTGSGLISVAKETGQAATTIVFENIVNMWARMWARSRANAVWFINQDTEPQLYQMSMAVGTGGVPVYMPANGIAGSPFATLMGRPVIPTEYQPTLGTAGDILLADMSQYVMIDKGEVEQASSMHVRFTQGEQAFRAIYRCDGQPIWESALTPYKGSNTQSPYVALAARS
jgi:HK97 family phage major capsid protein